MCRAASLDAVEDEAPLAWRPKHPSNDGEASRVSSRTSSVLKAHGGESSSSSVSSGLGYTKHTMRHLPARVGRLLGLDRGGQLSLKLVVSRGTGMLPWWAKSAVQYLPLLPQRGGQRLSHVRPPCTQSTRCRECHS